MIFSIEGFFYKGFLQLLGLFSIFDDDEIFSLFYLVLLQATRSVFCELSQERRTVLVGLLEVILNALFFLLDIGIS